MHIAAAVFAAALALATQAQASDGEATNCILQVDGTVYLEGDCKFSDDGTHAQIGPLEEAAEQHRARIQRRPDNHATGWWNGPQASLAANIDLGLLEPRGRTCWANDRARICFTATIAPPAAAAMSEDEELAAEIAEEMEGDQEDYRTGQLEEGDGEPDFGSAMEGLANAQSLTCLIAEEELYAPDMRVMLRGYGGRRYTGNIPQRADFIFDDQKGVTLNGNSHEVVWQAGDAVAVRASPQVSVPSQMPGSLTAEQLSELQQGMNLMKQLSGQATGLDKRVIVLNFAERSGVVVTVNGKTLSQHQPLRCQ